MTTETPKDSNGPWWQRNVGTVLVLTFVSYAVVVTGAHFVPTPTWLASAQGFAVSKLGPLGDSFGPLTALFAAIAAIGAWRSYGAQRQQLEDERNRHRGTRFDETFFRLIEHYDHQIAELRVVVPQGQRALSTPGDYGAARAVGAFKQTVKIFQFANEALGSDIEAFNWGFTHKYFKPLLLLREQEIAITRWLKRQSKNVAVSYRGALLVAKLSDDELWFWYFAIQCTEDAKLIAFARQLGIDRKRALKTEEPKVDPGTSIPRGVPD